MKEGWEYKKLGEVCETCSGGTPSKSHPEYYERGTIPWLRSGEISQGLIYKTELFITEEGLNKSSAKMIPVDTVSIAMYGATIGQVGIIKTPMCTNQAICNILPNDTIFPLFLKLFLQSKKEKFVSLGAGGAQPNISQNIIRDTLIPLPPLTEQQSIVAELDKINEIIDLKKAQLKDLDLLAQSIFYDMFGDPIENSKGWEVKKLGEVCEYARTRTTSVEITVDNYVGVDNLLQNCQGKKIAVKVPDNVGLTLYKEGDVLLGNIRPYLKKIWLATNEGACNGDVLTIRVLPQKDNLIHRLFLLKSLSTDNFFEYDNKYAKGEKMPRGDKKEIMKYPLILPPLSLQQSFAEKIQAIESQKSAIKQSLAEVETLLASRMDYWFN
ncbi:MAG: restriction endonuclease subunit S [Bacteroidaceae bacterium]|nr:restriction endonuclease subunit S [Bacteroidaceae bacterium]